MRNFAFYRQLSMAGLLATVVAATGCGSTAEMMPVERVATYSEQADSERVGGGQQPERRGGVQPGEEAEPAKCQKYRDRIETFESAYAASVAVGTVGFVAGLLSNDETVQKAAGLAGNLATLAQAGTATAAEITADSAQERGCRLP